MALDSTDKQTSGKTLSRRWLYAALLIAFIWLIILGSLVVLTANPVTFNRRQILESDLVVVATVANINQQGMLTLKIEQELLRGNEHEQLTIKGHEALSIHQGEKYLIPLSRTGNNTYKLTRTDLPKDPPLVYPATESAVAYFKVQLAKWRE